MNETLGLLLLALSLGGATAWATTGAFSVGGFVILAALIAALGKWLRRLPPWSSPILAPMVVLIGWLLHAKRWGGEPLWPALCLGLTLLAVAWETIPAAAWTRGLTPARLLAGAYGLLALSIALGGMPTWCLLTFLTAPIAWRARTDPDARAQLTPLLALFITVGYLIKGLIR